MRSMPAARCSGASAVTSTIVVQLGHDTMPFGMSRTSSGLTSADHERDVGVHAERGRVVDDARAARHRTRRPLERERVVDVDDDEVEAVEAAVARAPAQVTSPSPNGSDAALGPRRRVRAQLAHREGALVEEAQHLGADETGGTDDADASSRSRAASSSNAACSARTARSTSSSCTTHEMRIVDVEIISMLTPSAASVSNICAATPGLVFMPAPTSETRPIGVVEVGTAGVDLDDHLVDDLHRAGELVARDGERDVGVAVGRHVLLDHVDVDVLVGERAEQPARRCRAGRAPGRS